MRVARVCPCVPRPRFAAYAGPYSKEEVKTWDSWTQSNDGCPFMVPTAGTKTRLLNVPPRNMWGNAIITGSGSSAYSGGVQGYCGETSVQSAALFYGNWIHSETVFQAGARTGSKATTTDRFRMSRRSHKH